MKWGERVLFDGTSGSGTWNPMISESDLGDDEECGVPLEVVMAINSGGGERLQEGVVGLDASSTQPGVIERNRGELGDQAPRDECKKILI